MNWGMRSGRALMALALLASTSIGGSMAVADSGSDSPVFEFEQMIGSSPNMPVRGVPSGAAPWVVQGEAKLKADGEFKVKVEGLFFTGTGTSLDGTTGAITGVRASLTCEGAGVVATTGVVPLNAQGEAEIEEIIAVPGSCVNPIVLVRVGSTTTNPGPLLGPWIAATPF